jgi:GNAT superfamily N-acetyltransferase
MNKTDALTVPIIRSEVIYLEMTSGPSAKPADLEPFQLRRVSNIDVASYLDVYKAVGRDYLWNYRGGQSTDEIEQILKAPTTRMYFLYEGSAVVGMAELDATNGKHIELVHFGLIPSLLHQGIGRRFLQNIIHLEWNTEVERMWLSTCGMDHPKALAFYENAGFTKFKTSVGEFRDWRFTGFYSMDDAPQIPYGEKVGR